MRASTLPETSACALGVTSIRCLFVAYVLTLSPTRERLRSIESIGAVQIMLVSTLLSVMADMAQRPVSQPPMASIVSLVPYVLCRGEYAADGYAVRHHKYATPNCPVLRRMPEMPMCIGV
jgi:hypothetical protein